MCVHRRCVVWLWAVECACTDGVLFGCGLLNVRAQTVCCDCGQLNVCRDGVLCGYGQMNVCRNGVLCGCGHLNVHAQTVFRVAVGS